MTSAGVIAASHVLSAPTTIPNPYTIFGEDLLGWYSADNLVDLGIADGTQLTTWPDCGPNNYDIVAVKSVGATNYPILRHTGGASGGPYVEFAGWQTMGSVAHGWFSFPIPGLISGVTEMAMWTNIDSDGDATNPYVSPWHMGASSSLDSAHYPYAPGGGAAYATGPCYENFGTYSGGGGSYNPTMAINVWRRHLMWNKLNDFGVKIDEVSQIAQNRGTPAFPNTNGTMMLGAGMYSNALGQPFKGKISCAVLVRRKPTGGEETSMATYQTNHPSGGIP